MDRHRQKPWHTLKLTEVYETLHTSEEGLGDAEAAERLRKNGRNELRAKPPKTILQMLDKLIADESLHLKLFYQQLVKMKLTQGVESLKSTLTRYLKLD